eukprot:5705967-Pyramimonas_sp.AAC.1
MATRQGAMWKRLATTDQTAKTPHADIVHRTSCEKLCLNIHSGRTLSEGLCHKWLHVREPCGKDSSSRIKQRELLALTSFTPKLPARSYTSRSPQERLHGEDPGRSCSRRPVPSHGANEHCKRR